MKNPFETARKVLQYVQGRLDKEDEYEIEKLCSERKGLKELADELKNKRSIQKEINIIATFDAEQALRKINLRRKQRVWGFVRWAAAIVILLSISYLWLPHQKKEREELPVAGSFSPGKATVTLQMADGKKYRLDTLSALTPNDRSKVVFNNRNGMLKLEKRDTFYKPEEKQEYNVVNVPYGGTYSIILSDGTKVYLNSGTAFEFPSRFGPSKREVKLRGEAYFEVAKDSKKTFEVDVNLMKVKVLGTSFNIKSYGDDPEIYTTLVHGSVAIACQGKADKRIKPGEQARYNRKDNSLDIKQVDVSEFTAWKDGLFYFKDTSLEEIMRTIARWYDLEVFYMNQQVKSVVYSGKLPMYTSVTDVLRKFEISGKVKFELKGRTLTVFDK